MEAREELIEAAAASMYRRENPEDQADPVPWEAASAYERGVFVARARGGVDAFLAHPDLVIAALGGEKIKRYLTPGFDEVLYRFPVREGTDGRPAARIVDEALARFGETDD